MNLGKRHALVAAAAAGLLAVAGCASQAPSTPDAGQSTQGTVTAGSSAPSPGTAVPTAGVPGAGPAVAQAPTPAAIATESAPPGDIPDNLAFVPFTPPGGRYRVSIPEGWSSTGTGTGTGAASAVTFTDKLNVATVELRTAAAAPSVASVNSADVPVLARKPGYQPGKTTAVSRNVGAGVLTTYRALSAPDPVTAKSYLLDVQHYVFFRSGLEAAITLSGPQGADNVDAYRTITDSFRWTP